MYQLPSSSPPLVSLFSLPPAPPLVPPHPWLSPPARQSPATITVASLRYTPSRPWQPTAQNTVLPLGNPLLKTPVQMTCPLLWTVSLQSSSLTCRIRISPKTLEISLPGDYSVSDLSGSCGLRRE
ncbi:hypothetical protein BO70DRAFT_196914 [Aspergillus heteromorphus CBS 117.55]|uniref:Uncharacterized protein n=1 Tax=Aspergillus heteromorphus CBS 117.55 TaxID=1448321 RepID=A0A317WMH5_9EURO|nr:uncharacterized protein BO70DRAFT_196914 [Aspergillus heteromorphus CBS 117.55]PWY87569.1 hypothetical protein BO70DRAFT_196914 [Aspergillus heteromorphus CBS 117.55]